MIRDLKENVKREGNFGIQRDFKGARGKRCNYKESADKFRLMAGFRDRLTRSYHGVMDKELYLILKTNPPDIEEFITEVKPFFKRHIGHK